MFAENPPFPCAVKAVPVMAVGIVSERTAAGEQLLTFIDVGKPRLYYLPEGIKPRIIMVKSLCHTLCTGVTILIKIGISYF